MIRTVVFCLIFTLSLRAEEPWWPAEVTQALAKAGENRPELEKALRQVPVTERPGMAFLIANMPDADLKSLKAEFLLTNSALAYKAREEMPWGNAIPEKIFLNYVLPYANVDEQRDAWRKEFYELCKPLVKDCKTPTDVTKKLNAELFKSLKLGYSTERSKPNQSPKESIAQGKASCTGLSIVLSDACRSVGVPARLVGTPSWVAKRGNHTWVEIWDQDWHFTGACEPDPNGLDRGWFVGDAARALKDSPRNAIYAASFEKTGTPFPLVWSRNRSDVPAENVTDRYAKPSPKADTVRVLIRVTNAEKKRVAVPVTVTVKTGDTKPIDGTSKGESADTNDLLTLELKPGLEFTATASGISVSFKTGAAGTQQTVEIHIPAK